MDRYQELRNLNPLGVLTALGVDITTFKKRSNKSEHYGRCPICQPKHNTTAFSIHDDGRWNCFSGGHKGRGAIDLVQAIKDCNFTAAVEFLKPLATNPQPPRESAPEGQPEAVEGILKPLATDSWRKFAQPCEWLEKRIPDARIRELYGVYMYNNPARKSVYSGRVMLPVKSLDGALYGYLGRDISNNQGQVDQPKYLFPKNLPKSHFLFGSAEIVAGTFGPATLKLCYLVESPFCVMKFAMYGLAAVSPFGWSVSEEQLATLKQLARGILYMPDKNKYSDSRGVVADIAAHLWVKAPPLPDDCEDPEQLDLPAIQALTH